MKLQDIELLAEVGLNEACCAIQEELGKKLGVTLDGDLAGIFFSDDVVRNNFIAYIKAELASQHWADEPKAEEELSKPNPIVALMTGSDIVDLDLRARALKIFETLAAQGVDEVTATYYGGGDEGGVQDIEANPPAACVPTAVIGTTANNKPIDLEDAIRDFCDELVYGQHRGWENNEGGGGTLVFDVKTKTISLDHYDNEVKEEYQDTQTFVLR